MKVLVLLAISLAVFVSAASAAPLCIAGGTMASYEDLGAGGCVIGDKLFSNFVYLSTGHGTGVAAPDTAVFLTPVNDTGVNPGPGIVFSSNAWVVPSASITTRSTVDSSISFTVTVIDGPLLIEGGTLTLLSSSTSGTGIADITETINPSGLKLQVDSNNGPLVSERAFAPAASVSVLKDLLVVVPILGATSGGFSQISSFEEDFNQTEAPEPASALLIGSGLLGLGLWRRRVIRRG
jgi:hypothetical protein